MLELCGLMVFSSKVEIQSSQYLTTRLMPAKHKVAEFISVREAKTRLAISRFTIAVSFRTHLGDLQEDLNILSVTGPTVALQSGIACFLTAKPYLQVESTQPHGEMAGPKPKSQIALSSRTTRCIAEEVFQMLSNHRTDLRLTESLFTIQSFGATMPMVAGLM